MSEIIYGIYAVQSILERSLERVQEVFISKERRYKKRLVQLINILESNNVSIQVVNHQCLDKKSNNALHQGIVARVKSNIQYQEHDLPDLIAKLNEPFLLILDRITDPHNLGACLRSADAAGVNIVIIPRNNSAQLNSTVRKIACGAAENIPLIQVTNLVRNIRFLKKENIWILGATREASHTIYQSNMTGRIALIIGSEHKGMRRLTREECNELISIPMIGSVHSLNVSVATGVCLFEAVRQRNDIYR